MIEKYFTIKWNFELTVFELTVPDLYLKQSLKFSHDSFSRCDADGFKICIQDCLLPASTTYGW